MPVGQRHNELLNGAIRELDAIGHNGNEFMNNSHPFVFDPDKAKRGGNPWAFFTPVKVPEKKKEKIVTNEVINIVDKKVEENGIQKS
jgi:hypothetical protein